MPTQRPETAWVVRRIEDIDASFARGHPATAAVLLAELSDALAHLGNAALRDAAWKLREAANAVVQPGMEAARSAYVEALPLIGSVYGVLPGQASSGSQG
jgi:hypothetical protein